MSTEAPRNSGTGEPTYPQRQDRGFSGFLRRFIGQPTTRITQPSFGLEDFAAKLHQMVDDNLVTQRQRGLELRRETTARLAAEAEERAIAEQRQREHLEGHNTRKRESQKVLQDFQIADRLRYIQKNVWGGMGTITQIDKGSVAHREDRKLLAGLELTHQYPACVGREHSCSGAESGDWATYTFEPEMQFTKLGIQVINVEYDEGQDEQVLEILSGIYSPTIYNGYSPLMAIIETDVPLGVETSVTLLEQALLKEIDIRLNRGFLPEQLRNEAQKRLVKARQTAGWQKQASGLLPNLGFDYDHYTNGSGSRHILIG